MKLYMHPVSMTSRPVRLFIAENNIPCEEQVVDLMTGEHMKPPYSTLNPNMLVPMLEDGDLHLTESSAILKYLADKTESPTYPRDLKKRAKMNELMDWFNTNFSGSTKRSANLRPPGPSRLCRWTRPSSPRCSRRAGCGNENSTTSGRSTGKAEASTRAM